MGFRPFYILKSGRGLCRLEIKGEFVALTVCKIKAEATQHGARLRSLTTSHIPIRFQSAVCQRARSSDRKSVV